MLSAPTFARRAFALICCALACLVVSAAPAQTIDLSLNVLYTDPGDLDSGGTWEVVAKSSDFGIHALSIRLSNINSSVQFETPTGTVNGSDNAGLWVTANVPFSGHRNLSISQAALAPPPASGDEQTLFYGVGTIANGEPGDIGPTFTTLTNVQNVPWATGDAFGDSAWDTAATFASGTFAAGAMPEFFPGTTGQVFASLGTSMTPGAVAIASTITTIVRDNAADDFPDYNEDGFVDAADYVLWRSDPTSYGGTPAGYDLWVEHFGEAAPGSGSGPGTAGFAVPEPATGLLLAFGATLLALRRRRTTS